MPSQQWTGSLALRVRNDGEVDRLPLQRGFTETGPILDNQVLMNIEMTSGGLFDTPTDIQRTNPPGSDGTIKLTFTSCNSGTVP
jgi:hypothetical protein